MTNIMLDVENSKHKNIKEDKAYFIERNRPTVSVIIVTYNGRLYIKACLLSVQNALWDDCEVIMVDNASTDGSADFVEQNFPEFTLIRNQHNRGFAAACNQGAAFACGEYLVFLNQDTKVTPGWLEALITALAQDDQISLATSKVLLMSNPSKIHLCGQDIHFTGLVSSRGFFSASSNFDNVEVVGAVSGASFAIHKDLWDSLGGFDEIFFMYYEETDLSWRAQLAGYQCVFVPESVVYHDYRSGRAGFSRLYYTMRNRWFLLGKNWGGLALFLFSPSLILAELIEMMIALRNGRAGIRAKADAYAWILKNIGTILQHRKQAQKIRSISDCEILNARTFNISPVEFDPSLLVNILLTAAKFLFQINYSIASAVLPPYGKEY